MYDKTKFNNQFATQRMFNELEEDSVTGSGESYQASLNAEKEKQNPFSEASEGFSIGDQVVVKDLGNINNNRKGEVISAEKGVYTVKFENGKTQSYQQNQLSKPKSGEPKGPQKILKVDESGEQVNEILTKEDYKKAEALLNKLKDTNSKIYQALVALIIDEYPHSEDEVDALVSKAQLSENYHRFKKETVTRSKEQQMHEAIKVVRKKLYEADKVMDYVKTMKEELGLQEYKTNTRKLMEKLQGSIVEIYKKYKSLK